MTPGVIVAGITRSGLSVTMQMLHAGGYPCAGEPPAFEPFPMGRIPWERCYGHAVKVVDTHLQSPPPSSWNAIRLSRDLKEQAKSFNKWNRTFGLPPVAIGRVAASFRRDYKAIDRWAKRHRVLTVRFEDLIHDPVTVAGSIAAWLGYPLDTKAAAGVVVSREAACPPYLLELEQVRDHEPIRR